MESDPFLKLGRSIFRSRSPKNRENIGTRKATFLGRIEKVQKLDEEMVTEFQAILSLLPLEEPAQSEEVTSGTQHQAFLKQVMDGRQLQLGSKHKALVKRLMLWVEDLVRDAELKKAEQISQLVLDWLVRFSSHGPVGTEQVVLSLKWEMKIYQEKWAEAEGYADKDDEWIDFLGHNKRDRLMSRVLLSQGRWRAALGHLPGRHDILAGSYEPITNEPHLFAYYAETYVEEGMWDDVQAFTSFALQKFAAFQDESDASSSVTPLDLQDLQLLALKLWGCSMVDNSEAIKLLQATIRAGGYYRNDRLFRIMQHRCEELLARIYIDGQRWCDAEPHLKNWMCSTIDQLTNDWGMPNPVMLVRDVEDLANHLIAEERWDDAIATLKGVMEAAGHMPTELEGRVIKLKQQLAQIYRSQGRMAEWQAIRFTFL